MSLQRCRQSLDEVSKLYEEAQRSSTFLRLREHNSRSDQERTVSERTNAIPGGPAQRVSAVNPNPLASKDIVDCLVSIQQVIQQARNGRKIEILLALGPRKTSSDLLGLELSCVYHRQMSRECCL